MSESKNIQRPVIAWLILVYDRNAVVRLPLERKWYRFNYDKATEAEIAEVIQITSREDENSTLPDPPLELGKATLSFLIPSAAYDRSRQILRFRHLFEYVPDERLVCSQAEAHRGFLTAGPGSYFEDESGKPITMIEIMDAEARRTGGEHAVAILYDEPKSLLRLGPATPARPELWKRGDSALVAHFLQVYQQIVSSRWYASECVVSPSQPGKYHAILPVPEDCMAVILPFRQLYSKSDTDDLFNRCCNIHNRNCPREHPAFAWVNYYKKGFNALLQKAPGFPIPAIDISAQRYLDAFAYGARVIHVSSKTDTPAVDLEKLLKDHPKEMVVMGYHYILRQLMRYASMMAPVIYQDVSHWVCDLGWEAHRWPSATDLFGDQG